MLFVTKDIKEERPLRGGFCVRSLERDQTALSTKVNDLMINAPDWNDRTGLKRDSFRNQSQLRVDPLSMFRCKFPDVSQRAFSRSGENDFSGSSSDAQRKPRGSWVATKSNPVGFAAMIYS